MTSLPRRAAAAARIALAAVVGGLLITSSAGAAGADRAAVAAAEPVYTVPSSGSWTVDGAGFGHGIGMSQWGAQGAAISGLTGDQIISFYYPGTTLGWVGNPNIRVQLTGYSGSSIVFGAYGGEQLTATDSATGQSQVLPPSSRYLLTIDGSAMHLSVLTSGGWALTSINGATSLGGPIDVSGPSGTWMYDVSLNGAGREYWGAMRFVRTGAGSAQAVNVLPLDAYTKFVVPREVPSSWNPAALRAQAIAARSYALAVSSPSGPWDICDTTACQVYGGRAVAAPGGAVTWLEAASTSSAVDGSSGIVPADSANKPAFTQFSSSNGGYSVAGSRPYLVAQPDPYSGLAPGDTVSRWRTQLSAATVQQRCPSGGTLVSFEVTGRDGRGPFGGRITAIKVNCTNGSVTVTGPDSLAFGMRSNMWRPSVAPIGNLESLTATNGGIRMSGWAAGPDTSTAVVTMVLGNGSSLAVDAVNNRADVAAAYPELGPNRGFDVVASVPAGVTTACVYADASGSRTTLGCGTFNVPPGAPFGHVDELRGVPGGIVVSGWTIDPDTTGPVTVQVAVNGVVTSVTASLARSDVGAYYPAYGAAHGFSVQVPATAGATAFVCAYAVNQPASTANPAIGCGHATTPSGSPIGNSETVAAGSGGVAVSGWAIDPDTAQPSNVRITVDGGSYALAASQPRPDVASVYPDYGAAHGYSAVLPTGSGPHSVCVVRINIGAGADVPAGCTNVVVPAGAPIGTLDSATVSGTTITAQGWAIDPDTANPISVALVVDGATTIVTADASRPDVGAVYPSSGPNHGFLTPIASTAGRHSICAYAINVPAGQNPWIGCATVTV